MLWLWLYELILKRMHLSTTATLRMHLALVHLGVVGSEIVDGVSGLGSDSWTSRIR